MLRYADKAKKSMIWAHNRRKGEMVDTERQKNCLLPVPRAAAAYYRQLKKEIKTTFVPFLPRECQSFAISDQLLSQLFDLLLYG